MVPDIPRMHGCFALNHIVVERYRLREEPERSPSRLATDIVEQLKLSPDTLSNILHGLKLRNGVGRRATAIDVRMALSNLIERGVVAVEGSDLTDNVLHELRELRVGSRRLGLCPGSLNESCRKWSLVSLYIQRRREKRSQQEGSKKYVSVGVLCVDCGYHYLEPIALGG